MTQPSVPGWEWTSNRTDAGLALDADVLCEGYFGIFQPKERVRQFIEEHWMKKTR